MSTSSSKVRITCDSPNEVIDRWISTLGTPTSARSTGSVTCFSTSSAACPGKRLITITWTLVTSGNDSTLSRPKREHAEDHERERRDHDQHPAVHGEIDEAIEHGCAPSP